MTRIPAKQIILDTDTTLSANSDTRIASQKAIKTYVDDAVNVLKKTFTLYGDNTTSIFTINHELNTYDVIVQVYSFKPSTAGGLYENMNVEIRRIDVDNITVQFSVAPPDTESFRVVIV